MKALVLTHTARRDLGAIAEHIVRERDVATALRVVEEIESAVALLRSHPELGRAGTEPGTRELVVGSYVVPYRFDEREVVVLRVWHARQRWWG